MVWAEVMENLAEKQERLKFLEVFAKTVND